MYLLASAQDLQGGSKEEQLLKGLNGATKMLGKISSKPQNVDAVIEAGGVEALVAAFTAAKGK